MIIFRIVDFLDRVVVAILSTSLKYPCWVLVAVLIWSVGCSWVGTLNSHGLYLIMSKGWLVGCP